MFGQSAVSANVLAKSGTQIHCKQPRCCLNDDQLYGHLSDTVPAAGGLGNHCWCLWASRVLVGIECACGQRGCPLLGVVCARNIFIVSGDKSLMNVACGLAGIELVAGCGVVCLSTSGILCNACLWQWAHLLALLEPELLWVWGGLPA